MFLRIFTELLANLAARAEEWAGPGSGGATVEAEHLVEEESLDEAELLLEDVAELDAPEVVGPSVSAPAERRRGEVRPTTAGEAVERALSMVGHIPERPGDAPDGDHQPLRYRLRSGFNGGTWPWADHPGAWSPPDVQGFAWSEHGAWTVDCSGFACWVVGLDRFQPGAAFEWLGTAGMLADARGPREFFEKIAEPVPGAIAVWGPVYREGKLVTVGHCAVVVNVSHYDGTWPSLRVVHAAKSLDRRHGAAIRETDARAWSSRGVLLRAVQLLS